MGGSGASLGRVASVVAAVLTVAALVVVVGTATTAVVASARAAERVDAKRAELNQIAALRDAVSDEAFAEAAFRRAPSPTTWQALEAAIDAVQPRIDALFQHADRVDATTYSYLGVLNARYARQTLATRGRPASGQDDRVAGPALDSMRDLLQATIDRHRDEVVAATDRQEALNRRMGYLLPVVVGIALVLLAISLRLTLRQQRHLRATAAIHRRRSLTDPLTGLANRAAFDQALGASSGAPTNGRPTALLLLDLDRFKPVNDTWGHPAGDQVLIQVAERLRGVVRGDDLAARIGGDEFAVLLQGRADPHAVVGRLHEAFAAPFFAAGHEVALGVSIGVATVEGGAAADTLMAAADADLYAAKRRAERGSDLSRREAPSAPVA